MHVPLLVRLNLFSIEFRRGMITGRFAEFNKLLVLLQCKRLARELSCSDALNRGLKSGEQLEHWAIPARRRIESGEVYSLSCQMLLDQAIVLRFITDLPRQSQFDLRLGRCWNPYGRDFAGFQLIFQSDF